jgi:hypothetical protein
MKPHPPFPRYRFSRTTLYLATALCSAHAAIAQSAYLEDLAKLTPGRTRAENALWIENELSARFNSSRRVVVADLKGPAVITMVHFAMPQTLKLNRDVLLRMYWDGESSPSVEVPLVDFGPAGKDAGKGGKYLFAPR